MVLERILLQTIKFDLQVEHPYMFLLRYVKQLKGEIGVWRQLHRAWEMMVLWANSDLSSRYRGEE